MFETIEVVRGSRVAVIWLNRPKVHNALNAVMVKELTQAIDASAHDAQIDAIVLASRGDSFCSGTDLNWCRTALDDESGSVEAMAMALASMLKAIETSPVPVIARVNGQCVGAGVGFFREAVLMMELPKRHAAPFKG
jgi:methylglutaconyl-CoA hydratase